MNILKDERFEEAYRILREYAMRMARRGYVTAHGGNLSIKSGNTIYITRHASSLENLKREDVIPIPLHREHSLSLIASTDTPIHLRIYEETGHLAVIHGHTPYAIVLSFFMDKIKPIDAEGAYVLKEIPVIEGKVGTYELADRVAEALKKHYACVVRGHGTFAAEKFMDVAYQILCMVEHSSHILYNVMLLKGLGYKFIEPKEL